MVSNVGGNGSGGGGDRLVFVKVMTDEQMEVLKKQISVYATICEQLVEMHRAVMAQQESFAGMRLGNLYCDPLMVPGGHKITARQRWTPTPMQLQILENMFEQGNGTPSKQKIKEITAELSQHGQISDTNVYNWFQNRRARSKRKQAAATTSNPESELEGDEDSPTTDKKAKSDKAPYSSSTHSMERSSATQQCEQESEQTPGFYACKESSRSSGSSGQLSFYENMLSNPRVDPFFGKVGSPASFYQYRPGEGFDMYG